jgi:hypothetical protein
VAREVRTKFFLRADGFIKEGVRPVASIGIRMPCPIGRLDEIARCADGDFVVLSQRQLGDLIALQSSFPIPSNGFNEVWILQVERIMPPDDFSN